MLTSLVTSETGVDSSVIQGAQVTEVGASKDIDIAKLIRIEHATRFFKPNLGIEIVVREVLG